VLIGAADLNEREQAGARQHGDQLLGGSRVAAVRAQVLSESRTGAGRM